MRVVVTGAGGFIGSHVAEAFAAAGHEVLAVDAPERSLAPAVARRTWAEVAGRPGVVAAEVDLAVDALDAVAAADVVHLAGRPGCAYYHSSSRAYNDAAWYSSLDDFDRGAFNPASRGPPTSQTRTK